MSANWARGLATALSLALSTGAATAQDALKVSVGGRGVGETPVTELGDKAGIFARHGLKLEIFYTDGGGETQQAVVAGSAHIGVASGLLGGFALFSKGAPVRVIGASFTGGHQVFWYVPAGSQVKTAQDLAGKTVAFSNTSTSTHIGLLALQKHLGVAFKLTATGNAAATYTAVMSGQVDAGWAGAPFGLDALEAGKIRLVMKSADAPDYDRQTGRVLIANAVDLKARPDVFARYMRGYRETLDWIYSTPDGLKAFATFTGLSESITKRAFSEFLTRKSVDPDRVSCIEEAMADAVAFKFIAAPLTKAQLDELIQIPEARN